MFILKWFKYLFMQEYDKIRKFKVNELSLNSAGNKDKQDA